MTQGNGLSRNGGDGRPKGRALEGILVADFSRVLAGPYATMLLADMGAEVVKVEGPGGDDTRSWAPPEREGVSTYYLSINRNKRSVVLDLKAQEDLSAAQELSRRADVFIQNFKPGGLKGYGLDYDAVSARNPRVVYCSISGFGTTGGANLPGYDLIVQAVSGLMSLTGDPSGPPFRAGISVFDVMTGLHSAIGILMALYQRESTGLGQHIETSLMASALSGLVNQTSAFVAGGVVPTRMGNAHPSLYPYETMPTADADMIITAGNDSQFRKLCEVLGIPEIPDDPRFVRTVDRTQNRAELQPILEAELRTRTASEWFRLLTAAGVPCGPINDIGGGVNLAKELGLDPVVEVGDSQGGVPMIRNPLTMSESPARYDLPPPTLGQDTDDVKRWLQGPTDEPLPGASQGLSTPKRP